MVRGDARRILIKKNDTKQQKTSLNNKPRQNQLAAILFFSFFLGRIDSSTIETYISENRISICEGFPCHSFLFHLLVGSESLSPDIFNA